MGIKSSLSESDRAEIKRLRAEGVPLREVAEKFGVSVSYVSCVARDKIPMGQPYIPKLLKYQRATKS